MQYQAALNVILHENGKVFIANTNYMGDTTILLNYDGDDIDVHAAYSFFEPPIAYICNQLGTRGFLELRESQKKTKDRLALADMPLIRKNYTLHTGMEGFTYTIDVLENGTGLIKIRLTHKKQTPESCGPNEYTEEFSYFGPYSIEWAVETE